MLTYLLQKIIHINEYTNLTQFRITVTHKVIPLTRLLQALPVKLIKWFFRTGTVSLRLVTGINT